MTEDIQQDNAEQLTALVVVLTNERDEALRELAVTRAERDQMAAMLAQIESSVAETLDTSELAPEPTDNELAQELDECRKALQATRAELDRTNEDLARAEFKARGQAARIRRQSPGVGPD